jgi:hypothetical protein
MTGNKARNIRSPPVADRKTAAESAMLLPIGEPNGIHHGWRCRPTAADRPRPPLDSRLELQRPYRVSLEVDWTRRFILFHGKRTHARAANAY